MPRQKDNKTMRLLWRRVMWTGPVGANNNLQETYVRTKFIKHENWKGLMDVTNCICLGYTLNIYLLKSNPISEWSHDHRHGGVCTMSMYGDNDDRGQHIGQEGQRGCGP